MRSRRVSGWFLPRHAIGKIAPDLAVQALPVQAPDPLLTG
jgi:hypothetical protein